MSYESYLKIRKYKVAPPWSGIWEQIKLLGIKDCSTDIEWNDYVSPSDYYKMQKPQAYVLLEKAKAKLDADAKKRAEWEAENSIDSTQYIDKWDTISDDVYEQLLSIAIETFPMMDGLEKVNETIRFGLEMKEAEIDRDEFANVVNGLFRIKVYEWAVNRIFAGSSNDFCNEIMKRVAAREFPTLDNVAKNDKKHHSEVGTLKQVQEEIRLIASRTRAQDRKFDKLVNKL